MRSTYAPIGSELKPYKLTQKELRDIGRLIRACAEIEDIISLYLFKLANLPEGAGAVLMGRTPASARLKVLETFSLSKGGEALDLYRQAFDNDNYRAITRCRNTVAHGLLLGLTERKEIAFQVQELQGVDGHEAIVSVNAYSREAFGIMADQAEQIIPQMEHVFGLATLREKRRSQALDPHMKAQGKGKQKAKRERPPPPSPE
jgi:hypothetical protein